MVRRGASRGRRSPAVLGLAALVVGLGAGIGVSAARVGPLDTLAGLVEPLGALWVNAIRMVLVPLVVSLLFTSVTSFADVRSLGRLGARTIAWFLVLLAGAAVFAALVGPPLFARLSIPAEASSALRAQGQSSMPAAVPESPHAPRLHRRTRADQPDPRRGGRRDAPADRLHPAVRAGDHTVAR